MFRSRWLRWMGLAIATLLIVVGCQSGTPIREAGATPVVLKMSGWGSSPTEQRLLESVLRDFEASHPHIRVRFETIADQYMDVLKTRMIGDAAPDVFYLDALEAPFLMSQGVLEPLDAYVTDEFDTVDFEESLLLPFQYQNQTFGFPKDYSTLALFYNKPLFAAAGLSRPPQTWDELRAFSQQLTTDANGDGRIDRYGFGLIPELPRQLFMITAFGAAAVDQKGYATFATDEALQGLQQSVDQYRRDRTAALKTDVGTNSGSEMFGQGKVAMVLEGNWAIPYLEETFPDLDFATAEVPKLNDTPATMVYTVAYVMSQQSPHKAEAWELISYLTGKEGMERWTSTGFALPTRKSVAEKLGYDRDPLRSPLVAGVSYATPWQVGPYPSIIMNNFDNQFISAVLGEQPLEQAMANAQTAANNQIKADNP